MGAADTYQFIARARSDIAAGDQILITVWTDGKISDFRHGELATRRDTYDTWGPPTRLDRA